jgi:uncharacterized protein (TIGR01777 family)
MTRQTFVRRTRIAAPAAEVFQWHARPGAFERLSPPWASVEVVQRSGGIEDGGRVTLAMPAGPVRLGWTLEHRGYEDGRQFRDVQLAGPFAHWEHTHRIEPDGPEACYLEDRIEYTLPLGALGRVFAGGFLQRELERLFDYRHRTTVQDLAAHRGRRGGTAMNILVTGSSGLIGSALLPFLTTGGHQVTRLVRSQPRAGEMAVRWDPDAGALDPKSLEGVDAVVHLAGENIAARWTAAKKRQIRDSRVKGTRLLSDTLARLETPPKVLVCASAIGYYGDRGEEVLTEESAAGSGFLAEVCRAWEGAAEPARQKGIRVVHLRFGVVLSPAGGALAKMLPPFRLGLGGPLGHGRQYMSWIAIDDAVGAIQHALNVAALQGPTNAVAPSPVTNQQFTKTLGKVLGRPTLFPMPAFAARLMFGEMADELLLASARVQPTKLLSTGYAFRYPDLEAALRHLLGK